MQSSGRAARPWSRGPQANRPSSERDTAPAARIRYAAPVAQSSDDPRRSRRILVVEDDPATVAALTAILEHAGHRVRSALDGRTGIDLARTFLPEVLIVDIRLPDTDGFDVARVVKADPALFGCYVIAVTGIPLTATMKSSAVDEYFVKPVEPNALVAAIDQAS